MFPAPTNQSGVNCSNGNAEVPCEAGSRRSVIVPLTNEYHIGIRQARAALSFSGIVGTVALPVVEVVAAGVPAKVLKSVVGGYSVVMACFRPFWSWTHKREQYQAVDELAFLASNAVRQGDFQIANWWGLFRREFMPLRSSRGATAQGATTVDTSICRDSITGPVWNWPYLLVGNVHHQSVAR